MGDLYHRLRERKARTAAPVPRTTAAGGATSNRRGLRLSETAGWSERAAHVWSRRMVAESLDRNAPIVPYRVDRPPSRQWHEQITATAPAWNAVGAARIRCIDIETTGLSTGAGTVAFLVGCGWFAATDTGAPAVVVDQYFLADVGYESELLSVLDDIWAAPTHETGEVVLVSYNGATFDLPILRSRYIMHRRHLPAVHHIDLLPPARRLWRDTLTDCSLGTIEETVLGVRRELDVAGELIPERYQLAVRAADSRPLDEVFAHHCADIVAVMRLYRLVDGLLRLGLSDATRELDPLPPYISRFALGRLLLERGSASQISHAERLMEEGLEGSDSDARLRAEGDVAARVRALRYLARYHRRHGRTAEALHCARRCWNLTAAFTDGELVAKILEHDQRDYEAAGSWVGALGAAPSTVPAAHRVALEHRAARVARKLRNSGARDHFRV